jgi:hypothetical protein
MGVIGEGGGRSLGLSRGSPSGWFKLREVDRDEERCVGVVDCKMIRP